MLGPRPFVPRRDQPETRPTFHPCINPGPLEELPQASGRESAAERGQAIDTRHPVESQGVTRYPEACPCRERTMQIGDDHPDTGDSVALPEYGDTGILVQMMRDLAQHYDVDASIAQGKRPPTSYRRMKPAFVGHPGGGGMPLEAEGGEGHAVTLAPAPGHPWYVARAGPHVEQCDGSGPALEESGEPVPHGRQAAEPAVGSRNVAQRFLHQPGIGGDIIEQLGAGWGRGEAGHEGRS